MVNLSKQKHHFKVMHGILLIWTLSLSTNHVYMSDASTIIDKFEPNNLRLFFGTADEQLIFYSKGWLTENIITIHKDK